MLLQGSGYFMHLTAYVMRIVFLARTKSHMSMIEKQPNRKISTCMAQFTALLGPSCKVSRTPIGPFLCATRGPMTQYRCGDVSVPK